MFLSLLLTFSLSLALVGNSKKPSIELKTYKFGLNSKSLNEFVQKKEKKIVFYLLCYSKYKQLKVNSNLSRILISGLLLAISWPTYGFSFFIFFALVPLLFTIEEINRSTLNRKGLLVFFYSYISFLIWNIISTWWIYNATAFGAVFAILCNSSFYALIISLYRWALTRLPKISSQLLLISLWISFEKFHLNWDFSWPWLNLGNVFSENIYWIQWYEFTGVFGGTLWVLLINFIALKWYSHYQLNGSLKEAVKGFVPNLIWIAIPIVISLSLYNKQKEPKEKVEVIVLQPNIDPYKGKYQLKNKELLTLCEEISHPILDLTTDYLITPEGYFDEGSGLNLSNYKEGAFRKSIKEFLAPYPTLSLLTGAQSFKLYPPSDLAPTRTANRLNNNRWYDVYNSAFQFNNKTQDQVYQKSKLVVGVEYMPYKTFFEPLIGDFLLDFGGTIATRGIQNKRTVFTNHKGVKTAPIICYESIYGAFVTKYVLKGAQFLSIITNDAWWGNTQGHKQLLSYARLRAIENRRAIARSANTGISAFINTKGEIIKELPYAYTGALKGQIELNDELTFYTRYGDLIARVSILIFILMISMAISGRLKQKAAF